MNPFLAIVAQNQIIANSLLTYTTGPLTFLFHPIFMLQLNITFVFPIFIFKPFASNPDFYFTILSGRLSLLSAMKIKVICVQ